MFRFIHTADIHLDSPLKGLEAHQDAPVDEIRMATRRAFDNLVELAIEQEVAFVLIVGDLYDGDWKDYNTGIFFVERMGRLQKAGIKVFIVSGNHDAVGQITKSMPLPANVTLFSHKVAQSTHLDDLGVALHGRSYAGRAVTDNLALDYPRRDDGYFNIGLLHTSLTGRPGHEEYAPCTLDNLKAKGYDYWALGHIHKREEVARDPWIVFPGNIQGRHIKETGPKGATLVTVTEGSITEVEHCDLDVLRWAVCLVDVTACDNREAIYAHVRRAMEEEQSRADDKTVAIRLQLKGNAPLHGQLHARTGHWKEEFRGIAATLGNVWLERVKVATNPVAGNDAFDDDTGPLSGLVQAIAHFEPGDGKLTDLIPDLANLKSKLPPSILDMDSPLESGSAQLEELLPEVKEMLIAELMGQGDGK